MGGDLPSPTMHVVLVSNFGLVSSCAVSDFPVLINHTRLELRGLDRFRVGRPAGLPGLILNRESTSLNIVSKNVEMWERHEPSIEIEVGNFR